MFRRGLHNLLGCLASIEVSYLINVSSQAIIKLNEKVVIKHGRRFDRYNALRHLEIPGVSAAPLDTGASSSVDITINNSHGL